MEIDGKNKLEKISEPDRIEIVPGLIFEDKLRIKTQRRLEKHFKLPVSRIFPGKVKDPVSGKMVKWDGVDFNFLENSIPLITILARQVNDEITEEQIENILDNVDDEVLGESLKKYFTDITPKPKNSQRSNRKKPKKK